MDEAEFDGHMHILLTSLMAIDKLPLKELLEHQEAKADDDYSQNAALHIGQAVQDFIAEQRYDPTDPEKK